MNRLVAVSIFVVVSVAAPGAANAHSVLASSQPDPGQSLGTAPGVVVLEFSEALNSRLSHATVTDPTGRSFSGGATGSQEMRVPLSTNAQGVYRVDWQTVSTLDGHQFRGSFDFGVGVTPTGGGGGTVATAPDRAGSLIAIARWIQYLALMLAVGLLLLQGLARSDEELDWVRPRARVRLALIVALSAGAVVVAGESFEAAGLSLAGITSYLTTGLPGIARVASLVLEGLAVLVAFVHPRVIWVALVASIVAVAASGHGAAISPTWWGITVAATHLLSAGVWAGGILALATLRPPAGWTSLAGGHLLRRFSPPALIGFSVTIGFGLIQGSQELGGLGAVFGSGYGRVLVAKAVLIGLMLPLSLIAWRLRRPHLRIEGAIASCVIAAAALLAAFPIPPSRLVEQEAAHRDASSSLGLPQPSQLTLGGHAGQVLVGLTLDPGRPGENHLTLYLSPLEGNAAAARLAVEVTVNGAKQVVVGCGDTCRSTTAELRGRDRITVRVESAQGGTANFDLPPLPAPDGTDLLQLMQRRMHELRTYRLVETLSSGLDVNVRSAYAYAAPDRMESVVSGKTTSIIIGGTRYLREHPGGPWQIDQGGPPLTVPSFIWDYFQPLRNAKILGHASLQGVPTTIVSFYGSSGGLPLWFKTWIDRDGLARLAEMRTLGHFMDDRYYDFGGAITISIPPTSGT